MLVEWLEKKRWPNLNTQGMAKNQQKGKETSKGYRTGMVREDIQPVYVMTYLH